MSRPAMQEATAFPSVQPSLPAKQDSIPSSSVGPLHTSSDQPLADRKEESPLPIVPLVVKSRNRVTAKWDRKRANRQATKTAKRAARLATTISEIDKSITLDKTTLRMQGHIADVLTPLGDGIDILEDVLSGWYTELSHSYYGWYIGPLDGDPPAPSLSLLAHGCSVQTTVITTVPALAPTITSTCPVFTPDVVRDISTVKEGPSLAFAENLMHASARPAKTAQTVTHPRKGSTKDSVSSFTIVLDNVSDPIAGEKSSCGDSGATDIMLNDPKAFHSFRRCHDKFVVLGGTHWVPIVGRGTAVFSLNRFIIKVWNALYVPSL